MRDMNVRETRVYDDVFARVYAYAATSEDYTWVQAAVLAREAAQRAILTLRESHDASS